MAIREDSSHRFLSEQRAPPEIWMFHFFEDGSLNLLWRPKPGEWLKQNTHEAKQPYHRISGTYGRVAGGYLTRRKG
jgi:hypothetical protein